MSNAKNGQTREKATADLRLTFAELYNELRGRGHEVTVAYDEPGDPLYIPHLVEVDGLDRNRLNVRFFVEPVVDRGLVRGNYFGVLYIPTNTARQQFSMTKKRRCQQLSKNRLAGQDLADWVERLLAVEKRAKAWEVEKGW